MLTKENFNESHIRMLQKQSKKDPALLERAVFAFGLLEAIRQVEMPFIFKGGTCLLLLLKHPLYPFMLADVDYFITMQDGTKAILEIKTTNYNAKDHWWENGRETVPVYYEMQERHYMAVMDIDRVFFCCLYGNTEDETIIRDIRRDLAYEDEMIYLEQEFWTSYVQKKVPPPYLEDGDVILASARQYCGKADKNAGAITRIQCSQ